jgi:hypothetical protein
MATAAAVDEIPEFDRPYVNDRPEHLRSATSRLKKKKKRKKKKKVFGVGCNHGSCPASYFFAILPDSMRGLDRTTVRSTEYNRTIYSTIAIHESSQPSVLIFVFDSLNLSIDVCGKNASA